MVAAVHQPREGEVVSFQPIDDAALRAWEGEIGQLCRALNALGAAPPWTLQSLSVYANEKFGVIYGLADLTPLQLIELGDDLSVKLDARLAERDASRGPSTPRARLALERAAGVEAV